MGFVKYPMPKGERLLVASQTEHTRSWQFHEGSYRTWFRSCAWYRTECLFCPGVDLANLRKENLRVHSYILFVQLKSGNRFPPLV